MIILWLIYPLLFLINLGFGYKREGYAKFSPAWFSFLNFSFLLAIFVSVSTAFSIVVLLICLIISIAGQIIGSRIKAKTISFEEKEKLKQISNLRLPPQTSQIKDEEIAVVLLNMGGPRTTRDVKDFLRRIFNDKFIIRLPLQSLFAMILVNARHKGVEQRYELIGGGSPIFHSTKNQVAALSDELKKRHRNLYVTFSFNYSSPLPDELMHELKKEGKRYILPLSLYPHYSAATTGSNLYYLKESSQKSYPELKFLGLPHYHLHPGYIDGFINRIQEKLSASESLSDFYLIFSAHGLPVYFLNEGDPYPFEIAQTVSLVLQKLNRQDNWVISYQSAVGPLEWLKPSTEDILEALAYRGIKKVLIIPIAFVNDHIETLCEIDIEYRDVAKKLGIEDYRMTKALECHPGFIKALADAIEHELPNLKTQTIFNNIKNLIHS